MSTDPDPILDELFHGCAFAAFLEEAHAQKGWPDIEATRRRAYQLYEETRADTNRERTGGTVDVRSQSLTIPAKCATVET